MEFRIIRNLARSCVAAICLVLLQSWDELVAFVRDYIAPIAPKYAGYEKIAAAGLLVSVLMLLFRFSEIFAAFVVERIPLLSPALRRVLAGRSHIEGDWPLIVVNTGTGDVLLEGFLNIEFKGGELYVSGTDWNPEDGTVALEFESLRSTYDKSVLRYFYRQGPNLATAHRYGYTEIVFFPTGRRAERHAGEFHDKETEIPMRFFAKRLPGGWLARPIRKPSMRRELAKAFRAEIEPELARILKEKALVDWA